MVDLADGFDRDRFQMIRNADIEFLSDFRQKIERLFEARQSSAEDPFGRSIDAETMARMQGVHRRSEVQELIRSINEMKPQARRILDRLNLRPMMIEYPPAAVGGPVLQYDVLDLLTDNTSEVLISKELVIGIIDQAMGALKAGVTQEDEKEFTYDFSKLHPTIIKECGSLFRTGHYPDAIFKAYKLLAIMVREKSGTNKDGSSLMSEVFSRNKPIIRLTQMRNQSEQDEQEGFMHLFMGAMLGIRNPEAHEIRTLKDPDRAFEYLVFASLLARRIEEGNLSVPSPSPNKSQEPMENEP